VPEAVVADPSKAKALLNYPVDEGIEVVVFDPSTGETGPKVRSQKGISMAINRSGDRFAIGMTNAVVVYDGVTGQELGRINRESCCGVYITPADQMFVSAFDGHVTEYDLDTLEPIRTFEASRGYVLNVLGPLDGSTIVTQGGDRSVTIFDVATGIRLGTPRTIADDAFEHVALSADGKRLAIDSSEGTQVWDLDVNHWIDAACRVAGRNLTRAEWDANLGDLAPYRPTCPDLAFEG
jgi:WD40 repeat protein